MENSRTWCYGYTPATAMESPTEVYFLLMSKKTGIQSSYRHVHLSADEKGCTGSPEYLCYIIVLAGISFYRIEDTSTAERITPTIYIAAGSTGVLERVLLSKSADFGLDGGNIASLLEQCERSIQPSFGDFHIAIEQYHAVAFGLCDSTVVAFGKAVVLGEKDQFHLWIPATQKFHGVVRGAIIGYDKTSRSSRCMYCKRGEELLQHLTSVPVENDDCGCHGCRVLCNRGRFQRRWLQSHCDGSRRMVVSIRRTYSSVILPSGLSS